MVPCDQPVSPSDAEWRVLERSSWGGVCFVGQWLVAQVVPGCSSPFPVASCLSSVLCRDVRHRNLNGWRE